MKFRQDRPQDEKDMAFETSGAHDGREAFAYSRNDYRSSTQLHSPCAVVKASIS